MILFIDEYVTVFRRKQKRCMRSVSSKHPITETSLYKSDPRFPPNIRGSVNNFVN